MIMDILCDIFSPDSSFGDRVMASIMVILMLAVVALLGFLVYMLVDSVGITATKTTTTVVETKQIVPAHNTTSFIMAGKTTIPMTTHHPESYHLQFKIDSKRIESEVNKGFFDNLDVGDLITVDYGFGRLSGSVEPVNIRRITNR